MKPTTKYAVLASASSAAILASLAFSYARGRPALPDQSVTDQVLTVPPGFEVERVAGPPLVDRPIVADFDEQGRLYVADSSGSNDKVEKQLADKPHRIVRLEDTDWRWALRLDVVFADKMMFPEGRSGSTGRCMSQPRPASGNSPIPTATALPTSAKSGFKGKR